MGNSTIIRRIIEYRFSKNKVQISRHAQLRMNERNISFSSIYDIVKTGKIIFHKNITFKFQKNDMIVVLSLTKNDIEVITIFKREKNDDKKVVHDTLVEISF